MKFSQTTQITTAGGTRVLTLPDWSTFKSEEVIAELENLLKERQALADFTAAKLDPTWHDLVTVWDELGDRIKKVYGPMGHLSGTERLRYPELEEIENRASELMTAYGTDLQFHEGLYQAHVRFCNAAEYVTLSEAQKRIIDETIKSFELAGVNLPAEKKSRLKELVEQGTKLGNNFSNNKLAATDAWTKLVTDEALLAGIPEENKKSMHEEAAKKGLSGWLITLQQPVVTVVLEQAENRGLREEVYAANAIKASELGPDGGKWDNGSIISQLLGIEHEHAQVLGFQNAAERSLAKKMAKSIGPDGVLAFLGKLVPLAQAKAEVEWKEMTEFAKSELGLAQIEVWDIGFVWERMSHLKHGVDQEAVRQYFPFTKVAEGFAYLLNRLYGVTLKERTDVSVYNPDVYFFEVYDADGVLRGAFYADLFAREGKRSGAWMDEVMLQLSFKEETQIPVAYLNCNIAKPVEGEAYLSHLELTTYFHEAGHVMHLLLGKTQHAEISMMNVEWDAVELPSQLMESWGWEADMLRRMSSHKKTGATIPDDLIQKLIGAKHFNCGLFALRQFFLGIYDMTLYAKYDPAHPVDPNAFWKELHRSLDVRPLPDYARLANSFSHIFAGGYSAGYYSYMWADGLVADVFAAFTETGDVYSREVALRYLREILEVGASRPMVESFRAFRGRDLNPDALAVHLGLTS